MSNMRIVIHTSDSYSNIKNFIHESFIFNLTIIDGAILVTSKNMIIKINKLYQNPKNNYYRSDFIATITFIMSFHTSQNIYIISALSYIYTKSNLRVDQTKFREIFRSRD